MTSRQAPRVLHIAPASASDAALSHLGGAKAVHAFEEYLTDRAIKHEILEVGPRSDSDALAKVRTRDLSGFTSVIIQYTCYVGTARHIKRHYPHIRIYARSINAEFLHWLDHARAWLAAGDPFRAAKRVVEAFDLGWRDMWMSRIADAILAITPWERDHYWSKFAPDGKVVYVPYFVPGNTQDKPPEPSKQDICVCTMASARSALPTDAARNFDLAVSSLGNRMPTWRFLMTGKSDGHRAFRSPRIEQAGFVDDLDAFLRGAKAVAVLSELGYGFKTKILEAIACGCFVLTRPGQFARLPDCVKPYCVAIDPSDPDGVAAALLTRGPSLSDGWKLADAMKSEAYRVLDSLHL